MLNTTKRVRDSLKHLEELRQKGKACHNCAGIGTTDIRNTTIICCVCKGSGACVDDCFKCEYHVYDFGSGELGCAIKDNLLRKQNYS